ncbi:MAG: HAMP domain-containing protein [Deltaproteobacteria bacterium]|nr:HAMP domain-containing protein [Deltaproteobacteria bacterium]
MRRLAALSIRWKVTLASMIASVTVLAVACAVFFAHELGRARVNLGRSLQVRADTIGLVSAASILFDDPKAAGEILEASRVDPGIVTAAIYALDGRPFATYRRRASEENAPVVALAADTMEGRFVGDRRLVTRPIDFKGKRVGFVALESDLADLSDVKSGFMLAALLVLALCIGIGWLLALQLQRLVTRPILALVESARTISRDRDYSVRVVVRGGDEIGVLARSFNEMLEQVEERDVELEAARGTLEHRVAARTRELQLEIGERCQVQATLVRQTEELTRSNADLEQFAYVASHDLQEPLRIVASYTQLLAETHDGQLGPDAEKYVRYAVDGALRMQNLISDLLAYARVARAPAPPQTVASGDLLSRALDNLQLTIEESGARVTHDELPMVRCNSSQLVQLFQNLVGNAIKFHGERSPKIHVEAVCRDGETEFSVRDNGIGFDSKYAAKIFVIFQRLHARGKYSGTGIGLAVCKKIVEHHGGRIWVESRVGQGSTFFFTIPQAAPDREAKEEVRHVGVEAS